MAGASERNDRLTRETVRGRGHRLRPAATAPGHGLRRELETRGISVRIDVMPLPSLVAVPEVFLSHARQARFDVLRAGLSFVPYTATA